MFLFQFISDFPYHSFRNVILLFVPSVLIYIFKCCLVGLLKKALHLEDFEDMELHHKILDQLQCLLKKSMQGPICFSLRF